MTLPIKNFRDVSGYHNRFGETMRPGLIFRGASLEQLSEADVAYMEDALGIRYILDYREEGEAALSPDVPFPKAEVLRISAMKTGEGFNFGTLLGGSPGKKDIGPLREYLRSGYANMPFDNDAYRALFDRLLRGNGGIYFHCSAGKDRTGLSAMLIMMALGMKRRDIIREYMLSNEYLKEENKAFYKKHNIPWFYHFLIDPLIGVSKSSIKLSLEEIRKRYPSYDAYLEAEYGIDEEKRQHLRKLYCTAKA